MQADSLGAIENLGYSFRLLGGFSLYWVTFACPLTSRANLGLDRTCGLRC
jgi:hypothetical protein